MNKFVLTAVALCASMPLFGQFSQRTPVPNFTYLPATCAAAPFSDVPAGSGFCRWIKKLSEDGITQGCGGGNFCPQNPVTREQMAVFLELAMRGTTTWSPWQGVFKRTILVNADKSLTDLQAGTALMDAMAGITDNASFRYVLKLEPRTYDLGSQTLIMKTNVELEGSGRKGTRITATTASTTTVTAAAGSVFRDLAIFADGTVGAIALEIGTSGNVDIDSCHIYSATSTSATAIHSALGSYTLRDSQVEAFGSSAVRAIHAVGGTIRVIDSDVTAIGDETGDVLAVEASNSVNGRIEGSTLLASYGLPRATAVSFAGGSLEITDSRMRAHNADSTYGVRASGGAGVTLRTSEINAYAASQTASGIEANGAGVTFNIHGLTVNASSDVVATGLTSTGTANVLATRITATGTSGSNGLWVVSGFTTVEASHIFGTNSAMMISAGTTKIGGSGLSGTAIKTGAGSVVCAASWNGAFEALPVACI